MIVAETLSRAHRVTKIFMTRLRSLEMVSNLILDKEKSFVKVSCYLFFKKNIQEQTKLYGLRRGITEDFQRLIKLKRTLRFLAILQRFITLITVKMTLKP